MPREATPRSLHSSPDSSTFGNLAVGGYWWKWIIWGSWLTNCLASLWGHWHVLALSSSFFIAILNEIRELVSQCICLQRNTSQGPSTQQQPPQETFPLCVLVTQLCLTLWPHTRLLWFPRQQYWSGLPFLSSGMFLTQGSNPGLLHCRRILYCLSHHGSLFISKSSLYKNRLFIKLIFQYIPTRIQTLWRLELL